MHDIGHHVRGIRIALEMMPKLGLRVPAELLEEFPPHAPVDSEAFNLHHELSFFGRLIDLARDPLIGLKLSHAYPAQAYGIFGYGLLSAPDLRTLFEYVARYGVLTYSLLNLSYEIEGSHAKFILTPSHLKFPDKLRAFYADRDAGAALIAFNSAMREPIAFETVELVHDGRGLDRDYRDFFGCDVTFNAPANSLAVSEELIDIPLPLRNEEAFDYCREGCEAMLARTETGNDLVSRIQNQFTQRPGYLLSFSTIAAELNMSERTLRRRLAELGTSYQELLQKIRFQISKDYLRNSQLRLKEIAELVGYSDPATFSSAFKKWSNGLAPSQYRRK